MPRKVDFHTEWAMPDPADYGEAGSEERKSGAPMAQAYDAQTGRAMHAEQAPGPQTKEKWFVAGGPAY
jgi:hypothetical protein